MVIGRVGEWIAYQYLKQLGPVVFTDFHDFEFSGRPVEVKTTTEHAYAKYDNRNTYHVGLFYVKKEHHEKLCAQHGLYCFVLLRDDGFASVKLKEAHDVKLKGWNSQREGIVWADIFKWKKVKNKRRATLRKVCTEPPFTEWRLLMSERVLQKFTREEVW